MIVSPSDLQVAVVIPVGHAKHRDPFNDAITIFITTPSPGSSDLFPGSRGSARAVA
jgi:hypothetical protein